MAEHFAFEALPINGIMDEFNRVIGLVSNAKETKSVIDWQFAQVRYSLVRAAVEGYIQTNSPSSAMLKPTSWLSRMFDSLQAEITAGLKEAQPGGSADSTN